VPCHPCNSVLRTKHVKIWWFRFRTLGWVWQCCPSKFFDGLIGAHTSVGPSLVTEKQHLWHVACRMNSTKASIQSSWGFSIVVRFQCCPHKQGIQNNNTFLISKDLATNLSCR
jgi:hypothetical protein